MSGTVRKTDIQHGYKPVSIGPKTFEIPSDWELKSVNSVSEKVTDGTHSTPNYTDDGIPFLSTKNLKPFHDDFDFSDYVKFITKRDHEELIKRANPGKGDILMSKSGTIGITQKVRNDLEFSIFVGLALIKPEQNKVNSDYLEQFFNAEFMQSVLNIKSPGSTRKTLNVGTLKKQDVILPPLSEQRRIAEILSTVDELIQQTEEIIWKIGDLRQGLSLDLLSQGINSEQTKPTPIGTVPSSWEITRGHQIFKLRNGKYISADERMKSAEYPVYGANGVIAQYNDWLVEPNTIIVGRVGVYCGNVQITDSKSWVTDNAIIVRVDESKANTYFVAEIIRRANLKHFASQTAQPRISQSVIQTLPMPMPKIQEQNKIVDILSTIDNYLKEERNNRQVLQKIKRGLIQDLLTGKVRVPVET